VQLKELEEKMEKINTDASAWSEFKNPEGRLYYYNSKTTESTWDKPIVFSDVIGIKTHHRIFFFTYQFLLDVQNQLEHINKTMHESEKEVKRLESEPSQLPPSTTNSNDKQQQQTVPTPAFINGFTLEKLDNNDARRFVNRN
jgi:hypothetical protein